MAFHVLLKSTKRDNTGRLGHWYTSSPLVESLSLVLLLPEFRAQNGQKQRRGVSSCLPSRSLQFRQLPGVMSLRGRPNSSTPSRCSSTLSPALLLTLCLTARIGVADVKKSGFMEILCTVTRRSLPHRSTPWYIPSLMSFTSLRDQFCTMFTGAR